MSHVAIHHHPDKNGFIFTFNQDFGVYRSCVIFMSLSYLASQTTFPGQWQRQG